MAKDKPFSVEDIFKTADGEITHEVGGRMVRDIYKNGALVAREEVPEYTCKFCGAPSVRDPSEQDMPPDYCHPEDHQ